MTSVLNALRTAIVRLLWLVIAIVLAVGGAGLVTAADHLPGTDARPELTADGDAAAIPALDAAVDELADLGRSVEALGARGRLALASLAAGDLDALDAAIADGSSLLAVIDADAAALRAALGNVPGVGPEAALRLSAPVIARYDGLVATVGLADGLTANWSSLTRGTSDAARLTGFLESQELHAAAAVVHGSAGRYGQALTELDAAVAALDEAGRLRDRLANSVDVSVLTRWLDLNRTYDEALRTLYVELRRSSNRVTPAIRAAIEAERQARAALPGDTRSIVVIMSDIARGGLNQAVIAIELTRGQLDEALRAAEAAADGGSG